MEQWTVTDDRPSYLRDEPRSSAWVVALAIALVIAAAAAAYWYFTSDRLPPWMSSEPAPSAPAMQPPAPAPAPAQAPVAPRHPLPEESKPAPKAEALPSLEMSDSLARETLAGLFGHEGFAALFRPVDLVRRIVATVDNLPRQTAPRRMFPSKDVPGSFAVAQRGEGALIGDDNFARYSRYVRALAAVDARSLVSAYVRAYPLFQRAYEELGYPGKYFNDRLMQAIDDMLAAPELDGPLALVQPKVVWQFADPDLEGRSAGQKMLMRMGRDNERRVKAKLREIRRELVAASRQD